MSLCQNVTESPTILEPKNGLHTKKKVLRKHAFNKLYDCQLI